MAMLFVLVLSGAFFWGVVNILQKYHLGRGIPANVMLVGVMLGVSLFGFGSQVIVFGLPKVSVGFWFPAVATVLLGIVNQGANMKALKMEDASIVSALQGLTPVFVLGTSWLMLKEFPTFFGLLGILSIVAGTYVLNLKGKGTGSGPFAPWVRLVSSKGALLALLSAFMGSISLPFEKVAVLNSSPMFIVGFEFGGIALATYVISKATGRWKEANTKNFLTAFGIGLILGIANVLMISGFLFGIVPYVGALKRFQIIVTTILAALVLKEKYGPQRIAAGVILVIGIVLIAF